MSNKFCSNCGSSLVKGAAFCSECGTAVSKEAKVVAEKKTKLAKTSSEKGKIILHRDDRFNGIAVNIEVKINDISYSISNGQRMIIEVTPGPYTISWKVWCRSWQTVNIEVEPGKEYLLHFVPDYLLGGFKLGGAV